MLKRAHVWPLPRSDVITFDVVASDVVLVCVVETTLKTLTGVANNWRRPPRNAPLSPHVFGRTSSVPL